jgi:predicted nucleic acid-binding protein
MIYFDTDVWIHSLVEQNEEKHLQSNKLIEESQKRKYVISNLNLQEILYVLGKLKMGTHEIEKISRKLLLLNMVDYNKKEVKRGVSLAKYIGFKNINDCIHVAIAESYCSELVTYNKKDFVKLQKTAKIKVTIL